MDLLYHYCSIQTFHSIVQNQSLHLSALGLSNDYQEGKIVATTFRRLSASSGIDATEQELLEDYFERYERIVFGLGFCLTPHGDQLSQWRGYGSDGAGVAIGFSRPYLKWLGEGVSRSPEGRGFSLEEVKYETKDHDEEIRPFVTEIKRMIDKGGFSRAGMPNLLADHPDEFSKTELESGIAGRMLLLLPRLYVLKSDAFKEENEWRLITFFTKKSAWHRDYRPQNNKLVPYMKYQLLEIDRQPIKRIVLGPKNLTPAPMIEDFLERQGFGSVQVDRSTASYR